MLAFYSSEVKQHKQPGLLVAVSCADPDDHRVTVADVNRGDYGGSSGARTLGTCFPTAAVVHGNSDGHAVIQFRYRDVGAVFRAELHGCYFGRDGVVGHVIKREGIGFHLRK